MFLTDKVFVFSWFKALWRNIWLFLVLHLMTSLMTMIKEEISEEKCRMQFQDAICFQPSDFYFCQSMQRVHRYREIDAVPFTNFPLPNSCREAYLSPSWKREKKKMAGGGAGLMVH